MIRKSCLIITALLTGFLLSCVPGTGPETETTGSRNARNITYTSDYGNYQYDLDRMPDVTTLFVRDAKNSDAAPNTHVLLWAQGGPMTEIDLSPTYEAFSDNLKAMDSSKSWEFVNVHQYQTLNPDVGKTAEIDTDTAMEHSAFAAAALFAVIKHFHGQGKKVYVAGSSYGALVVNKMMADYHYEDYVEKVLVLVGRLKMQKAIYDVYAAGNYTDFEEEFPVPPNGYFARTVRVPPTVIDETYAISNIPPGQTKDEYRNHIRSLNKYNGVLSSINYIDVYTQNSVPLDKVLFLTGEVDRTIGFYTEEELDFAQENATLYVSDKGHAPTDPEDMQAILRALNGTDQYLETYNVAPTGPYGHWQMYDQTAFKKALADIDPQLKISDLYEIETFKDNNPAYNTARVNTKIDGSGSHYLLYVQGGPLRELRLSMVEEFPGHADFTEDRWTYVKVHQYQTLVQQYGVDSVVDLSDATTKAAFSAAILFYVAKHLSERGRKVYILGHSYGGFIIPNMIAKYKQEYYVEQILSLAGRLQMPKVVYSAFAEGNGRGYQDSDGDGLSREYTDKTIITEDMIKAYRQKEIDEGNSDPLGSYTVEEFFNLNKSDRKLQAGVGQYDYVKIYTDNNIYLGNVTFVTGKKDNSVGYFLDSEIAYANTHSNLWISESGHDTAEDRDKDTYVRILEGLFP